MKLIGLERIAIMVVTVAVIGAVVYRLFFYKPDSHKDATPTLQRLVAFRPLHGDMSISLALHAEVFEIKGRPGVLDGFKIAQKARELETPYEDVPDKVGKLDIAKAQCGIPDDAQAMLRPKR